MKKRAKLLAVVAGVMVLVIVLLLKGAVGSRASDGTSSSGSTQVPTQAVPSPLPTNAVPWSPMRDTEVGRLLTIRKEMEHDQVPLDFYGRAVDQNGVGVADATVKLGYTHFDLTVPQYYFLGEGSRTLKTDAQGFFRVSGLKGYDLTFKVSKVGYLSSKRNFPGAKYANAATGGDFTPDLSKPVVYLLWKKTAPVTLIHYAGCYVLRRDGTPVFVDLLTGETNSANPDLKIQSWVDDSKEIKLKNHGKFDWRVRIEMLNGGGLKPTDDEFAYTAPETGYVDSAEAGCSISDTNKPWSSGWKQTYYVKLRGGSRYERMPFEMVPGGGNYCAIDPFLNPTGSHNLEPDNTFINLEQYNNYLAAHPQAAK